jgi:hypothetical protein
MYIIAQINPDLLGVTGVIATILAVIFGFAAFYNSRTRKKQLLELERSQKKEQAMHFRPVGSLHQTSRSIVPSHSSLPHASSGKHPANSSPRASTPRTSSHRSSKDAHSPGDDLKTSSKPNTPNLFRKVRPNGVAEAESGRKEQDEYIWE